SPALAVGVPADRRLPVRPGHLLQALRRAGRLRLLPFAQADVLRLPPAPADQPGRGHPGLPAGPGPGQREGRAALAGPAGGHDRHRRPGLLVARPTTAAGPPRGGPAGAAFPPEHRPPTPPARPPSPG